MATRVSIKDIAAQTGVSFQTVSKVLKGQGTVAPETRKWILEVAEQMGYVPNALARSLVNQQTATIGIVANDLSDYVLAQFVVGAEREARRQEKSVIVGVIDEEGMEAERLIRILLEQRVTGIVLAAPQLERNPGVREMLRGQVPVVSMYHVPGGGIPTVGSDHARTGLLATQHLLDLGHRRIGTILGPQDRQATQTRLRGYQRALSAAGIEADPELIEESDWLVEGGYAATRRLLERVVDITAIFAQNDMMAVGVLGALREMGRRVPEDFSVVGCDDITLAAYTVPALTTVHLPFYETGEMAVQLLLDIITKRTTNPKKILLPVHLVQRASTGPA
ncbi:MAG: LacI family DNA-binding transcriptional regulator [Ktedonobacteraceae bacterium]|nr:LacI family DNA-binding transcriptional regulator [Ktedonobacteraceae bacterium]